MSESTTEAISQARRRATWMVIGLTAWWLVLMYPVVVTVGWGYWVFLIIGSWTTALVIYLVERKRIRANTEHDPAD